MTARTPRRLVLWDIDQTLVHLPGLATDWYTHAFASVVGVALRAGPAYHGRTERSITTELLTANGVPVTEDLVRRLWAELIALSEQAAPTMAEHGTALPGAETALSTVASQDGVVQSLVTGNLVEIARHKLAAFGLDPHLDFEIGGYGSVSADRHELVADALARAAAKHNAEFTGDAVAVIGDTPRDVDAARKHGAVAVGVATGQFTEAELRESGAQATLPDLTDSAAVLAAIVPR